jgi:hypothetical protein
MSGNLCMIYQQWVAVITSISRLFSELVSSVLHHDVVYFTERVLLYYTYVKYDLLESIGKNFDVNLVSSRQTIHNLVNKHRSMGLLIDKKQKKQVSSAYWGKVRWHRSQTWTYT